MNRSATGRIWSPSQAEKLLLQLLALPGSSGQEGQISGTVKELLLAEGAAEKTILFDRAHQKSPVKGEVGNLIWRLPGTLRGKRRMFVAHLDTVPICVGARPVKRGGQIVSANSDHGLGGDDRAGVAVLLSTAVEILRRKLPHPPLTFLWTVQEEVGLCGARHATLTSLGKPQMAFNFDGRKAAQLTIGATGGYRMDIEIRGLASHAGGHPEEGISAIAIASLAISDLVHNGWHGLVEKNGKRGTSNVGVIHGGTATNVVTDLVHIRAEARGHDRKFREQIVKQIERAFQHAAQQVQNAAGQRGTVKIDGHLDYEAFCLTTDEPAVVAAQRAVEEEGCTAEFNISNGGLDANWLTARGIPTVTLGCGQHNIHTSSEWLDSAEFHRARRIALRLALDTG